MPRTPAYLLQSKLKAMLKWLHVGSITKMQRPASAFCCSTCAGTSTLLRNCSRYVDSATLMFYSFAVALALALVLLQPPAAPSAFIAPRPAPAPAPAHSNVYVDVYVGPC